MHVTANGSAAAAPEWAMPRRITADFDDLGSDFGELYTFYQQTNLAWSNWGWIDGAYSVGEIGPNGFDAGVVTGNAVAYNGFGEPASVASSDGTNFDLDSVWLTAAYRLGLKVEINAYDDGALKYSRTVRLDNDSARQFSLDFDDVDQVVFTSFGGREDPDQPAGESGFQFAADNFVFGADWGSVQGQVFDDRNGNGVRDRGEQGIAGRTVFADTSGNGVQDSWEPFAVTNDRGLYRIDGLRFGTYDIWQVLPEGAVQTSPVVPNNGYVAQDVAFNWVNIARPFNALAFTSKDDAVAEVKLDHAITVYGETHDTVWVSTNGLIAFDGFFADLGFNSRLPDGNSPNGVIAPYWDDLTLGETGAVYFRDDAANERLIFEWRDVALLRDPTSLQTFEVILGYDGAITFQYKTLGDGGSSATVGLENGDNSFGLTWSFDEANLSNGQAIGFTIGNQQIAAEVKVDSGEAVTGVNFGAMSPAAPAEAFGDDAVQAMPWAFRDDAILGLVAIA